MRCLMTVCLALGLLAVPALAQPPRGGFGQMGIGQLLMNKSVQEELKLDKESIEKITAAIGKVREDMKDDLAKLREQDTPREERQAINKKLTEATTKAVADLVKPEQMTRVKQIQLQVQGLNAFNNPEVQKAVNLTDDQKEDIKKVNDEAGQKVRELFQDAQGDQDKIREMRTKITAMTKENMEKVTKSLKPEQQKALKELLGAPFELKIEPRRPN
jgi:ribosome recycling factor